MSHLKKGDDAQTKLTARTRGFLNMLNLDTTILEYEADHFTSSFEDMSGYPIFSSDWYSTQELVRYQQAQTLEAYIDLTSRVQAPDTAQLAFDAVMNTTQTRVITEVPHTEVSGPHVTVFLAAFVAALLSSACVLFVIEKFVIQIKAKRSTRS